VVFLPVMLLTGAAKYLFTPMALAVVFSILASYGISRTLVPVMSRYLLLENAHGGGSTGGLHAAVDRNFERLRRGYVAGLRW